MTVSNPVIKRSARWIARFEAVAPLVKLGMLTMTGMSTTLLAMQQYGYRELAWPFVISVSVGALLFTYFYAEGGVYNKQRRDKHEFGQNYAAPTHRIRAEMIAAAVVGAMQGEELNEDSRRVVKAEADRVYHDLRDGITIPDGGMND